MFYITTIGYIKTKKIVVLFTERRPLIKKIKILLFTILLLITSQYSFAETSDGPYTIDKSSIDSGIIKVKFFNKDDKLKHKLMVSLGDVKYYYDLINEDSYSSYPLQMGNGDYKISIFRAIEGTRYASVLTENIKFELKTPNKVYLNPIFNIDFDENSLIIKKTNELVKNKQNKQSTIFNYLSRNVSYDYSKAKTVAPGYIPVLNDIYKLKKGICYDYSSLFAAAARSQGIPTKLVMGYSKNVDGYHAWNEIFIKDKWMVIDVTYDSSVKKYVINFKDSKNFTKVKEF